MNSDTQPQRALRRGVTRAARWMARSVGILYKTECVIVAK
jgi:hypothetical protein